MNKTKIEWTDYTWNPVVGCKKGCSYCYAAKLAKRFYGTFEPQFFPNRLTDKSSPYMVKKPSKIFVVSMGDLFGDWVPRVWIEAVIKVARENPHHTFQFLTKNPKRYHQFKFPKNCWLGVTITKIDSREDVELSKLYQLWRYVPADQITFISFEPLLGRVNFDFLNFDWIIIGPQTNPNIQPKKEWVDDLIKKARINDCAVFLKDKLDWDEKIQEYPKGD